MLFSFHHFLKFLFPDACPKIGFSMTGSAQAYKVIVAVIVFVVIYVMNMQSMPDSFLFFMTFLACIIISLSYFFSKRVIEVFWIPYIKPALSFAYKRCAIFAINISFTSIYEAFCLADCTPAPPSAQNGDSVVMPVVFPSVGSVSSRPFTRTLCATKMICYFFYATVLFVKHNTTVFAGNVLTKFFLKASVVIVDKFSFSPSFVILIKKLATTTTALYNFCMFFHSAIITKPSLPRNGKEVMSNDVYPQFCKNRQKQDDCEFPRWTIEGMEQLC